MTSKLFSKAARLEAQRRTAMWRREGRQGTGSNRRGNDLLARESRISARAARRVLRGHHTVVRQRRRRRKQASVWFEHRGGGARRGGLPPEFRSDFFYRPRTRPVRGTRGGAPSRRPSCGAVLPPLPRY